MSQPVGANGAVENPVVENPGQVINDNGNVTTDTPGTTSTLTHEQALAELSKVRAEAADRRVKNRDLEAAAKRWQEYEESQKSELQKLQDQLAAKDKAIADKELEVSRSKIAREFNVADEDLDLLVGDETNMKRLAARLGKKDEGSGPRPADLMAGNRGTPVGNSGNTFSMDDFIRGTVTK